MVTPREAAVKFPDLSTTGLRILHEQLHKLDTIVSSRKFKEEVLSPTRLAKFQRDRETTINAIMAESPGLRFDGRIRDHSGNLDLVFDVSSFT